MNIRHKTIRAGGILLLECMAYIGLLFVVTGFAVVTMFHAWDDNKGLRRNADDIARALHAGEQWRADLRVATGPVRVTDADGAEQLRIPSAGGEIMYDFAHGELHRQTAGKSALLLPNVKSSQMQSDSRPGVAAWRWELELTIVKQTARCRPLFTFETVAGEGGSQ